MRPGSPPDGPSIRVLLVQNQAPIRRSWRRALKGDLDIEVAGECDSGEAAIEQHRQLEPDVLVVDIMLAEDGIDGIETTRRVLDATPDAKVLVLSGSAASRHVKQAVDVGARGYLVQSTSTDSIGLAVRAVERGAFYFDETAGPLALGRGGVEHAPDVEDVMRSYNLTARELEILQRVAVGKTNLDIGRQLHLSVGTVRSHVNNILRKTDLDNRTQAAYFAFKRGLLDNAPREGST